MFPPRGPTLPCVMPLKIEVYLPCVRFEIFLITLNVAFNSFHTGFWPLKAKLDNEIREQENDDR